MIEIFRKLFSLFDATERRRFWFLTGVMVLVAAAEIAGISAVLMLLNVLAAPETIRSGRTLSYLSEISGLTTDFSFQVGLAIAVLSVVMIGLAIKAAGTYATIRFSTMRATRFPAVFLRPI